MLGPGKKYKKGTTGGQTAGMREAGFGVQVPPKCSTQVQTWLVVSHRAARGARRIQPAKPSTARPPFGGNRGVHEVGDKVVAQRGCDILHEK